MVGHAVGVFGMLGSRPRGWHASQTLDSEANCLLTRDSLQVKDK